MSDGGDDPLNAAREALKQGRRTAERGSRAVPGKFLSGRIGAAEGSGRLGKLQKIIAVADVLWNEWLRPVARFLNPVAARVLRFYRWSYQRYAHLERADGVKEFSRNRAAFVTVGLAAITLAAPYFIFGAVLPAIWRTTYDAAMLATIREERLFLGRAELVDPDAEIYQVLGCQDISGCDGGENTTYYRLRDNIILDIQHWATRFEPYDPAEIAGAMVSELNDCTITYYGRRSRTLGWYPYIIRASCTPV